MTFFIHFANVGKTISDSIPGSAMNMLFSLLSLFLKTVRDDVPLVLPHRNSIILDVCRSKIKYLFTFHVHKFFLLCTFAAVVDGVALEMTVIFRNSE